MFSSDSQQKEPPLRIAVIGGGVAAVTCARELAKLLPAAHITLFVARGKFATQMHGARNQVEVTANCSSFYDYGCQYVSTRAGSEFAAEIDALWVPRCCCVELLDVPAASRLTTNAKKSVADRNDVSEAPHSVDGRGGGAATRNKQHASSHMDSAAAGTGDRRAPSVSPIVAVEVGESVVPFSEKLRSNKLTQSPTQGLAKAAGLAGGVAVTTPRASASEGSFVVKRVRSLLSPEDDKGPSELVNHEKSSISPPTISGGAGTRIHPPSTSTSSKSSSQHAPSTPRPVRCFIGRGGMWNVIRGLQRSLAADFPGRVVVEEALPPNEKNMVKALRQVSSSASSPQSVQWELLLGKGPQKKVYCSRAAGLAGTRDVVPVRFDFVLGAFGQHVLTRPFLEAGSRICVPAGAPPGEDKQDGEDAASSSRLVDEADSFNPCATMLEQGLKKVRYNQLIPLQVRVRFAAGVDPPSWVFAHVVADVLPAAQRQFRPRERNARKKDSVEPEQHHRIGGFPLCFVANNSRKLHIPGSSSSKGFEGATPTEDLSKQPQIVQQDHYFTLLSTAAYAEYQFNFGAKGNYRRQAERDLRAAFETVCGGGVEVFDVNRVLHWEDAVPTAATVRNPQTDRLRRRGNKYESPHLESGRGFLFDSAQKLGWCGDFCVAPCVEGAWHSGRLLARRVAEEVQQQVVGVEKGGSSSTGGDRHSCSSQGEDQQNMGVVISTRQNFQKAEELHATSFTDWSRQDLGMFAFSAAETLAHCETHFFDRFADASPRLGGLEGRKNDEKIEQEEQMKNLPDGGGAGSGKRGGYKYDPGRRNEGIGDGNGTEQPLLHTSKGKAGAKRFGKMKSGKSGKCAGGEKEGADVTADVEATEREVEDGNNQRAGGKGGKRRPKGRRWGRGGGEPQ